MIQYVVLLKRRPEIDHDTFMREWRGGHLALIRRLPGLRRCVLSEALPTADYQPGYDGMGVLWFDSVDAALAAFSSPEGQATRSDTPRFADPQTVIRFFGAQVEEVS